MAKLLVTYGLHENEYEITKPVGEGLIKEKIPSTEIFDLRHKKVKSILNRSNPSVVADIHAHDGLELQFLTEDRRALDFFEKYIFSNEPQVPGVIASVFNHKIEWPFIGDNTVSKCCSSMNIPYICVELTKENKNSDIIRYLSKAFNSLVGLYGR